jgi:hypothetical protein
MHYSLLFFLAFSPVAVNKKTWCRRCRCQIVRNAREMCDSETSGVYGVGTVIDLILRCWVCFLTLIHVLMVLFGSLSLNSCAADQEICCLSQNRERTVATPSRVKHISLIESVVQELTSYRNVAGCWNPTVNRILMRLGACSCRIWIWGEKRWWILRLCRRARKITRNGRSRNTRNSKNLIRIRRKRRMKRRHASKCFANREDTKTCLGTRQCFAYVLKC